MSVVVEAATNTLPTPPAHSLTYRVVFDLEAVAAEVLKLCLLFRLVRRLQDALQVVVLRCTAWRRGDLGYGVQVHCVLPQTRAVHGRADTHHSGLGATLVGWGAGSAVALGLLGRRALGLLGRSRRSLLGGSGLALLRGGCLVLVRLGRHGLGCLGRGVAVLCVLLRAKISGKTDGWVSVTRGHSKEMRVVCEARDSPSSSSSSSSNGKSREKDISLDVGAVSHLKTAFEAHR